MFRLSLHGNRLRELPKDLECLASLKELDITNNLFTSVLSRQKQYNPQIDSLISSLSSIPKLVRLHCNIKTTEEQQKIIKRLPRLEQLNGHPVVRKPVQNDNSNQRRDQGRQANTIKKDDLEAVAMLYDRVRGLYRKGEIGLDEQLARDFDEHVENVMNDLNFKIKSEDAPSYIVQARVLCAKYALIDLCFTKMISFLGFIDMNTESVLEAIHDEHAELFRKLAEIVLFKHFVNEKNESENRMKKITAYSKEIERLRRERDELGAEVVELQSQNSKYLQKLVSFGLMNKREKDDLNRANTKFNNNNNNTQSKVLQRTPSRNLKSDKNIQMQPSQSFRNLKMLTLNQTKELIEQMYTCKQRFDEKCLETGKPLETLQQYMYTFFNKKYGLKNLTIEWAKSLVNAIRAYGQDDNDIAVFAKILRNEIEEDFWQKQKEVKRNVEEALRNLLKIKGRKLNHEIEAAIKERQSSLIPMTECAEIVRFLFGRGESEQLIMEIETLFQNTQPGSTTPKKSPSKTGGSATPQSADPSKRKVLKYSTFINVVLQRKMAEHEQELRNFNNIFHELDSDSDGMLSQEELKSLVKTLSSGLQEADEIISQLDPENNGVFTYSKICSLFLVYPPSNPLIRQSV